jgi:hypothetical protein
VSKQNILVGNVFPFRILEFGSFILSVLAMDRNYNRRKLILHIMRVKAKARSEKPKYLPHQIFNTFSYTIYVAR